MLRRVIMVVLYYLEEELESPYKPMNPLKGPQLAVQRHLLE